MGIRHTSLARSLLESVLALKKGISICLSKLCAELQEELQEEVSLCLPLFHAEMVGSW